MVLYVDSIVKIIVCRHVGNDVGTNVCETCVYVFERTCVDMNIYAHFYKYVREYEHSHSLLRNFSIILFFVYIR